MNDPAFGGAHLIHGETCWFWGSPDPFREVCINIWLYWAILDAITICLDWNYAYARGPWREDEKIPRQRWNTSWNKQNFNVFRETILRLHEQSAAAAVKLSSHVARSCISTQMPTRLALMVATSTLSGFLKSHSNEVWNIVPWTGGIFVKTLEFGYDLLQLIMTFSKKTRITYTVWLR